MCIVATALVSKSNDSQQSIFSIIPNKSFTIKIERTNLLLKLSIKIVVLIVKLTV